MAAEFCQVLGLSEGPDPLGSIARLPQFLASPFYPPGEEGALALRLQDFLHRTQKLKVIGQALLVGAGIA